MRQFGITLTARLRHAALLKAARAAGSQRALAGAIGINEQTLGQWINLRRLPKRMDPKTKKRIEQRLFEFTQQTWDELFPPQLCEATEFLNRPPVLECTKHVSLNLLAADHQSLLAPPAECEIIEVDAQTVRRRKIREAMNHLRWRERMVLNAYYGLGRRGPMKQVDMARKMHLSKARIYQLLHQAEYIIARVLRGTPGFSDLMECLDAKVTKPEN
jgi:hypothetical protein